jgi:hypothetical protein
MSQPRLYLDEDTMRRSLVYGLRARNVDVLTAADAGMIHRSDEDHLVTASASERVLYTFNVADYCVLHQSWIARAGYMRESSSPPSSVTRSVRNFGGS